MSFLEQLQHSVEIQLNRQDAFLSVPVISHQTSNFESCLNELVQTGLGLCIVVLNPIPLRIIPGAKVVFEHIHLRIQVIESPCTNTTGMTALNLAEQISLCLHHFQPPLSGWKGWLTLTEWKELKDKQDRYILEICFQAHGSCRDSDT